MTTFIASGGIAVAVSGALSAALGVLGGVVAFLTSPITLVGAAIVALIALFVGLYNNVEGFRNFVDSVVEIGKNLILGLLQGISDVVSTIGTWLKENILNPIVSGIKSLFGIQNLWSISKKSLEIFH